MNQAREGAPCPEPVLAAIPWYPDGLSDAQRGVVEVHAAECGECREEIALVQGSSEAVSVDLPDPERVFARVMALVESDERGGADAESQLRPQRDGLARAAAPVHRTRWLEGRRGAVAAGIVLGALLGTAAGLLLPREPTYEMATTPAPYDGLEGATLDVVFRSDVTAEAISEALRAIGAQIVSGPTGLGRYRLELDPSMVASDAADSLRAGDTGVATFAEPVRD